MAEPQHAGDPRHPDHQEFLLELGRATYAASLLAGITFDVLRVLGGVGGSDYYSDPLGRLEKRLEKLHQSGPGYPQSLERFLVELTTARETRNDLLHALPVLHGLHRRRTEDAHYVRNFFDVEDLRVARSEMETARGLGCQVLYHDDGKSVQAWYEKLSGDVKREAVEASADDEAGA